MLLSTTIVVSVSVEKWVSLHNEAGNGWGMGCDGMGVAYTVDIEEQTIQLCIYMSVV
jgi:hypothetical protein